MDSKSQNPAHQATYLYMCVCVGKQKEVEVCFQLKATNYRLVGQFGELAEQKITKCILQCRIYMSDNPNFVLKLKYTFWTTLIVSPDISVTQQQEQK